MNLQPSWRTQLIQTTEETEHSLIQQETVDEHLQTTEV